MEVKRKKTAYTYGFAAFLIPFLIMTVAGASIGIVPFGNNSFLVSDISAQFAAFYTYFKHAVLSDDSFLYSLSKTLGGDMAGFSGYYLHNPFALILLLFPDEKIPVGIWWMEAVQTGCLGLSCFLFLHNRNTDPKIAQHADLIHLVYSLSYALMGYVLAYLTLPIYLSSLIALPLVILGLDRFLKDQRHFVLYALSLFAAIWCNYYLGYMICIFCALYFLCHLITDRAGNFKQRTSLVLRFAGISVLAVLLDAFSLIPVAVSLSGEKKAPGISLLSPQTLYSPKALIRNLLPGTFTCDFSNAAAPYIYVGMITLAGVLVFVFFSQISIPKRLVFPGFLILLLLSTWFSSSDVLWHAFNEPVGFAHRQAFLICFLMIMLADEGLINRKFQIKPVIMLLIFFLQIAELTGNSILSVKSYEARELADHARYESYMAQFGELISSVKENDASLYRIEKDVEYNHNDAMLFSYAGLTHNSSCEKDYVREFMGRLGFRNQGIWSFYNQGSTSFADSLLGVKYFISRFDSTNKPYERTLHNDTYYVYNNPYALPLAFTISDPDGAVLEKTQDLFAMQNAMAAATGGVNDLYTTASFEAFPVNLEATDETIDPSGEQSGLGIGAQESCTLFRKAEPDAPAKIDYVVSIDKTCNLFCYFAAPFEQGCNLYVNGDPRDDYFTDYRWGIVNLGNFVSGDKVTVTLELTGDSLRLYQAYFYTEDLQKLALWHKNACTDRMEFSRINACNYEGHIEPATDRVCVVSVPYEHGWTVRVDGKKIPYGKTWDALLSFQIPKGSHDFSLSYFPFGMKCGIMLSLLSAGIFLLSLLLLRKKSSRLFTDVS